MECLARMISEKVSMNEKRKFLRFPLLIPAECHYSKTEAGGRCRIVDISQAGLGFEIAADTGMRSGQNVLLKISIPDRAVPVSAIAKLKWIQRPHQGDMPLRVGGNLMFMDVGEKAHLLKYAYAEALADELKTDAAPYASKDV